MAVLMWPIFLSIVERIFYTKSVVPQVSKEDEARVRFEAFQLELKRQNEESRRAFELLPPEEKEKILNAQREEMARTEAQRLEFEKQQEKPKPKPLTAEELKARVLKNITGGGYR